MPLIYPRLLSGEKVDQIKCCSKSCIYHFRGSHARASHVEDSYFFQNGRLCLLSLSFSFAKKTMLSWYYIFLLRTTALKEVREKTSGKSQDEVNRYILGLLGKMEKEAWSWYGFPLLLKGLWGNQTLLSELGTCQWLNPRMLLAA